ncbi:MAG: hypothetical protein LUD79_08985 [Oscillospiraceae bacterium]|nr:hypothetical protein [Oscillospiraceae bacterium]
MSEQATSFASGSTRNKDSLRYLRAWLRGKYERTLQNRGPFFPGHGKQGFFFGGSTPFLFAPSKRNGVEKAHSEMNTKSGAATASQFARFLARKLFSVFSQICVLTGRADCAKILDNKTI